jgi:DNA topoisomerase-2
MNKTISDVIENEYKSFSKYVISSRAIPSYIDGFKNVNRKLFTLVKNKKSFEKVASISGEIITLMNYNHGDVSAASALTKMAQDFCGSNNLPLFEQKGTFGNRFIKEASAPRYIYVKKSKIIDYVFKDFDLCPENVDPEYPEPLYYLPIIPNILVNGAKGIAVGFAVDIPNHDTNEIIEYILNKLENKKTNKILPFYKGYSVPTVEEEDNFIQYGKYIKISDKEIHITEVPVSYDREKYLKILQSLEDNNDINEYIDNSKTNWDITVKLDKKSKVWEDPISYLKLKTNINYNITTLDENNQLYIFKDIYELLDRFISFRLNIFEQRRLKRINDLNEKIKFNFEKIKFIIDAMSYNFKEKNKKQVYDDFNKKYKNEYLDKFLTIQITQLNTESIIELKKKIKEFIEEKKYYEEITAKELYKIDLIDLKNNI